MDANTITLAKPCPGVALITIARAARLNAIDPPTDAALAEALAQLEQDSDVRCIVLTGEGEKAFCAGADIPTYLPWRRERVASGQDDPQVGGMTHRNITTKPMLAAINGWAFGGGLELALSCDMRIASNNARFGLPEIKLGVLAGAGGVTRLPRTIPAALAAEMILTGEPIDAQRALQAGLVSRVVEPAQLMPQALQLAQAVASRAPLSLAACTRLIRRARFTELEDALAEERNAFAHVLLSQDATEGIAAFEGKRPPAWRGM